MQVVNRKERKYAKWKFAGIYLLALAIPVFLVINGVSMRTVDSRENEQLLIQLRKRDMALAELSRLATTLSEMQRLKPPYMKEISNQEKYDQLRFKFEKNVENMKRMYYNDTTIYKLNYNLLAFLENNQKEYEKTAVEYKKQLDNELVAELQKANASGGSGDPTEMLLLQNKLQFAQNQISDLKIQLASSGSTSKQVQNLREKAIIVDANIDRIISRLEEIESECSGIQRKSDNNLQIKQKVLAKVQSLKRDAFTAKNKNSTGTMSN